MTMRDKLAAEMGRLSIQALELEETARVQGEHINQLNGRLLALCRLLDDLMKDATGDEIVQAEKRAPAWEEWRAARRQATAQAAPHA